MLELSGSVADRGKHTHMVRVRDSQYPHGGDFTAASWRLHSSLVAASQHPHGVFTAASWRLHSSLVAASQYPHGDFTAASHLHLPNSRLTCAHTRGKSKRLSIPSRRLHSSLIATSQQPHGDLTAASHSHLPNSSLTCAHTHVVRVRDSQYPHVDFTAASWRLHSSLAPAPAEQQADMCTHTW